MQWPEPSGYLGFFGAFSFFFSAFGFFGAIVGILNAFGFLRAFIGVSCVLAVYAWADSLPDEFCRERSLAILRLWQGVDGYREVRLRHQYLRPYTYTKSTVDLGPLAPLATDDLPSGMHVEQRSPYESGY